MLKSSVRRVCLATLLFCYLIGTLAGCFLLPNRPPVASFVVIYNVAEEVMVVDLDARTSSDPDGDTITTYMWAFDDDVVIISPQAFSATVNHPVLRVRFPDEGEYDIQLLVIDERGAASEVITQTIMLPVIVVDPTQ